MKNKNLLSLSIIAAICLFILVFAGCGNQNIEQSATATATSQSSETLLPNSLASVTAKNPDTTLMVYMIGSDLEARGGNGSSDLCEMEESGIDLSNANVVVYAGGSANWHNDVATKEKHTVMQLTNNGFVAKETFESSSMGDSECLAAFLNFAYENYPAENYALILWNHGSGPVIGYGMDMLYDNDSLTLREMMDALEASPFGAGNKLDFVGFDACLMASAELSFVWADYAEYLIASQEVEPWFGWDYSFLSEIGKCDTVALGEKIISTYMDTCEAYYEKKGYENCDTTLSLTDLSAAHELGEAINALFALANADIEENYNLLATKRINTRALGRASTGSEYDLIDLYDMAKQLEDTYPSEAQKLQSIISEMVIVNGTNTVDCCGMSMYYPFYNKYYFESSWNDIYFELGLFESYQNYLNLYQQIWLEENKLEEITEIDAPEEIAEGKYTLMLTEQQLESYASSRYYILKREGTDVYTISFASSNITNDNGLLTANFDGNVIYAKNNFDEHFIPVMVERDTVGKYSRFSSYVGLQNMDLFDDEFYRDAYYLNLTLNNETGEFSKSGWTPVEEEEVLVRGKNEDVDLSNYTYYVFPEADHLYIERYENGLIKPISEWRDTEIITLYQWSIPDGLEFVYAPIQGGEYYLLFEILDTQDNKYCSELLPIQISEPEGSDKVESSNEPVTFNWEDGEKCLFVDQNGVKAYITKSNSLHEGDFFAFEVESDANSDIEIILHEIVLNGNIYTGKNCYIDSFADINKLFVNDFSYLGLLENLNSMSFFLEMTDYTTKETLIKDRLTTITFSDETTIHTSDTNYRAGAVTDSYLYAKADEQILYNKNGLKITLVGGGKDPLHRYDFSAFLRFENTSDSQISVSMLALEINGMTLDIEIPLKVIPRGMTVYDSFRIPYSEFFDNNIFSINQMSLAFVHWSNYLIGIGSGDILWLDVNLTEKGDVPQHFLEGEAVLMDENSVKITLVGFDEDETYYNWYFAAVNDSNNDICLSGNNGLINESESFWVFLSKNKVGAHQKAILTLKQFKKDGAVEKLSFNFLVKNFTEDVVLFESLTPITLYTKN